MLLYCWLANQPGKADDTGHLTFPTLSKSDMQLQCFMPQFPSTKIRLIWTELSLRCHPTWNPWILSFGFLPTSLGDINIGTVTNKEKGWASALLTPALLLSLETLGGGSAGVGGKLRRKERQSCTKGCCQQGKQLARIGWQCSWVLPAWGRGEKLSAPQDWKQQCDPWGAGPLWGHLEQRAFRIFSWACSVL